MNEKSSKAFASNIAFGIELCFLLEAKDRPLAELPVLSFLSFLSFIALLSLPLLSPLLPSLPSLPSLWVSRHGGSTRSAWTQLHMPTRAALCSDCCIQRHRRFETSADDLWLSMSDIQKTSSILRKLKLTQAIYANILLRPPQKTQWSAVSCGASRGPKFPISTPELLRLEPEK